MPADDVGMVGWLWGFAWTHVADLDGAFSQEVFNITVTKIESIVEPDSVADDVWRKSVALVCIHLPIIRYRQLSCQYS